MTEKSVLVLVLHKVEVLDQLLRNFNDSGIAGATVLNSVGMAHELHSYEDSHAISSLRALFSVGKSENRTIFTVLDNNMIETARKVINDTVGGLENPNTGILFTIPLSFVEGLGDR